MPRLTAATDGARLAVPPRQTPTGRHQGHPAGKPGFGPSCGAMIAGWTWPSEGSGAAAPAAIRAIAAEHPTRSVRERWVADTSHYPQIQ
jgi:hypothetical protein